MWEVGVNEPGASVGRKAWDLGEKESLDLLVEFSHFQLRGAFGFFGGGIGLLKVRNAYLH